MICSAPPAAPCHAPQKRGACVDGRRPCVPCLPQIQDGFLPGPDLQVLVPRDAEVPHFAQLAGLDVGVPVRVFIQAQKFLDFQNADRIVRVNVGQS